MGILFSFLRNLKLCDDAQMADKMRQALALVEEWAEDVKMSLNGDKTKILKMRGKKKRNKTS